MPTAVGGGFCRVALAMVVVLLIGCSSMVTATVSSWNVYAVNSLTNRGAIPSSALSSSFDASSAVGLNEAPHMQMQSFATLTASPTNAPTMCPPNPKPTFQSLHVISQIFGWIYFLAWSISFIPQFVLNWRRKSVVGLSFEFLMYNMTGFLWYTVASVLNYWSERHYHLNCGKYSVQIQDLCFGAFASLMTAATIAQIFVYERADQKLNLHHVWLCGCMWIILFYNVFLASIGTLDWLKSSNENQGDFTVVQYMAVVKAIISLIKGLPQAYMNYKRKSTVGWSITNILLDLTGGSFSFAQMFVDAYNNNAWNIFSLNPAKTLLSAVTLLMDGVFLVQHYLLYTDRTDRAAVGVSSAQYARVPAAAAGSP